MKKVWLIMVVAFMMMASCRPKEIRAEPARSTATEAVQLSESAIGIATVTLTPKPQTPTPTEMFLPVPSDLLLVRIVDKNHPVDQAFIDEIEKHLVDVDTEYLRLFGEHAPLVFGHRLAHELAVADLCRLLKAAKDSELYLRLRSSYRDIESQQVALSKTGSNTSFVTLPTESQHHTGLAFDFTTPSMGNELGVSFGDTPEAKFLQENAAEYGFVESYVANHGGIVSEPWHYLYLSPALAKKYLELKALGMVKDPFEFQALYPQP